MVKIIRNTALFFLIILNSLNANEQVDTTDPRVIPIKTKQPLEKKVYPIAIIGAGAAGTMAVKRAVLNNNETLLFAGAIQERRRSRGNWVRTVDNIPGLEKYKRAVLEMRNDALLALMKTPLSHNLYVIEESVFLMGKEQDYFFLVDGKGHTYYAKYVVMATGMMDEQPHIQESIRHILPYSNGQKVAYCTVCDGHRSFGKKTVIIGHAESAASIALMLSQKYQLSNVTILTNGKKHEFDSELMKKIQSANIAILEDPILEIVGNKEQKELKGFKLQSGQTINAEMSFVSLGIRPNNQLALQLGATVDERGLVITDSNGETDVPNLFVVGDLRSKSMKQIYTAWQNAVESLQCINKRLREEH